MFGPRHGVGDLVVSERADLESMSDQFLCHHAVESEAVIHPLLPITPSAAT